MTLIQLQFVENSTKVYLSKNDRKAKWKSLGQMLLLKKLEQNLILRQICTPQLQKCHLQWQPSVLIVKIKRLAKSVIFASKSSTAQKTANLMTFTATNSLAQTCSRLQTKVQIKLSISQIQIKKHMVSLKPILKPLPANISTQITLKVSQTDCSRLSLSQNFKIRRSKFLKKPSKSLTKIIKLFNQLPRS